MKHTFRTALPGLAILLVLLLPGLAVGDLYWESAQVTQGIPGQTDATRLVKHYITKDFSRTDVDNQIMIMNYKTMMMYNINPGDKTYTEVNMKEIGLPEGMDPAQAEKAQEMIKQMFGDMKVVPTNEKKTIAGYECRKYDVDFMMVKTEYWTSKQVKGYQELKEASKKMQQAFAQNPILKNTNIMGMMDSLDGFPVEIVNHMMGGSSVTTLKKVEQKKLSPSLFKVPAGYTLKKAPPPPSMPPAAAAPPAMP